MGVNGEDRDAELNHCLVWLEDDVDDWLVDV